MTKEELKQKILAFPCVNKFAGFLPKQDDFQINLRLTCIMSGMFFEEMPLQAFKNAHLTMKRNFDRAFEEKMKLIEQLEEEYYGSR